MIKYGASLYNYLFNSVNSLIVLINGIIMVPLYLNYFSVSVYGAWLASGNLIAMIGLLESGFASVITQKLASALGRGENRTYRILAGANIISAIILSVMVFVFALFLSPFVANIVNVEAEYAKDITLAFILSALSTAISIFLSLMNAFPQVWQETRQSGVYGPLGAIVGIVSLVVYLVYGLGVVSLGLSYVTRSLFVLVFQGRWIYRRNKARCDGAFIYSFENVLMLTKDCIYPFLSKLANVFMGHSTSLIIAVFLNPTIAAVFDLTGKIANVSMGFLNMVNGSFFALFSLTISKGLKNEIEKVISMVSCFCSCLIVAVIIFAVCFSKVFINVWVGLDKFGGDWLLITIVISSAIAYYKSFFNNLLFSAGRINKASIFDIACLVIYFLCLCSTLWCFDEYAIPISMGVANILFLGVYINNLQKTLQIDLRGVFSQIIQSFVYPSIIIVIYMLLRLSPSNILAQVLFFVFALFFFAGYVFMNSVSRQLMFSMIKKVKRRNEFNR